MTEKRSNEAYLEKVTSVKRGECVKMANSYANVIVSGHSMKVEGHAIVTRESVSYLHVVLNSTVLKVMVDIFTCRRLKEALDKKLTVDFTPYSSNMEYYTLL